MPRQETLSMTLMCLGKEMRPLSISDAPDAALGTNSQVSTLASGYPYIDEGPRPQLGKETDCAE